MHHTFISSTVSSIISREWLLTVRGKCYNFNPVYLLTIIITKVLGQGFHCIDLHLEKKVKRWNFQGLSPCNLIHKLAVGDLWLTQYASYWPVPSGFVINSCLCHHCPVCVHIQELGDWCFLQLVLRRRLVDSSPINHCICTHHGRPLRFMGRWHVNSIKLLVC